MVARRGQARLGWVAGVLAALAALVAVAIVLVLVLVRSWEPAGPAAAPTAPPAPTAAEPDPVPVLAGATGAAPALDPAEVHAAIDELVTGSGLGRSLSAAVVDAATGEQLYGFRAGTPTIPASTIKLVTAATVLASRGPAYQIPTTAVAGAEPGEVVLVGGGDPTLALGADGFYPGAARLDLLASQVLSALGDTAVTKVTVDSTLFTGDVYGPWTGDIPTGGYVGPVTALMADGARMDPKRASLSRVVPRWSEPDLVVGEEFAELLGLDGGAPVRRGAAPTGADVLGEVVSPPLLRLVELMLTGSDNTIAELLARQVALAEGEPASFKGAAAAMTAVLSGDLGIAPAPGITIADGSGLSRENQLTAGLLTDLLAVVADPDGRLGGVLAGLPVAGWSGTLATRHDPPPSQLEPGIGTVRAKTGSLTGVDALAGVVATSTGRLLAFAVLADDVPIGRPASWVALDRIPATLATL
jgi:D-alanyl-D-alanine carboxypeptidase/D-alanyl-D-alanine-endopeptidase (penicillin-binding protein 4)